MTEPSKEAVDAMVAQGRWPAEMERLLEVALPIERNRWEQEVRERLAPLLDDYTEAVEAFCRGERGASLRVNGLEKRILAIFGEAEPVEEGQRCGGSPGNPRPVDRGSGPDGKGRLPWKLCSGCRDCQPEAEPVEGEG